MADVLAVRDEYRTQTWAMLIQECNRQNGRFVSSVGSLRKAFTTNGAPRSGAPHFIVARYLWLYVYQPRDRKCGRIPRLVFLLFI